MTKNEINEKSAAATVLTDTVRNAMVRAYGLGQTWWQQADSEYRSENKKADVTAGRFMELTDEICGKVDALAQAGLTAEPAEPLTIALGQGLIEVGQGHHGDERLPAILFGRNGAGAVGVETEGNRVMEPGECIAAITFRNRASLEVVSEKLDELRARIWPESAPAVKPWQERMREDKSISSFNACLAEIDEHRAKAAPTAQVPAAEVRAQALGDAIEEVAKVGALWIDYSNRDTAAPILNEAIAAIRALAQQSTADSAGTGAMGEGAKS